MVLDGSNLEMEVPWEMFTGQETIEKLQAENNAVRDLSPAI